jgi:hypothetical protein
MHPIGRELAWDYYRFNYDTILEIYGEDDPRIGLMLIDICKTFETQFLFYELLVHIELTTAGSNLNARNRAVEYVSLNVLWLVDKEDEISAAFSFFGKSPISKNANPLLEDEKKRNKIETFKQNAKEAVKKYMMATHQL